MPGATSQPTPTARTTFGWQAATTPAVACGRHGNLLPLSAGDSHANANSDTNGNTDGDANGNTDGDANGHRR